MNRRPGPASLYPDRLDDSTLYATIYGGDGRPVATMRRRHRLDAKDAPAWEAFTLDGASVRKWYLPRTYPGLLLDLEKRLAGRPVPAHG